MSGGVVTETCAGSVGRHAGNAHATGHASGASACCIAFCMELDKSTG